MTQRIIAVLLVLNASAAMAEEPSIRGRMDRYATPDIVTASGVKVALWHEDTLKDSTITGQDGMFYFINVPKDTYRIEITPPAEDSGLSPFSFTVRVREDGVLDLPARMLNRFTFDRPAEGDSAWKDSSLDVAGTHSYPSGAVIWLEFTAGRRNYLLPRDTVVLEAGRPWSTRLAVPEKATGLVAVLVPQNTRDDSITNTEPESTDTERPGDLPEFDTLPVGARIIAIRRFATR